MWRESVVKIADDMGALACSIVPAHPWVYGLGQNTDSGGYLSPANAMGYLAKKLLSGGGSGDVIVMMVAENTHDAFMQGLNKLSTVFPAPVFTQVSRMAAAAAELSTAKMQLPVKADVLPASAPLSVSTNRRALNAQRVAAAQLAAAVSTTTTDLKNQITEFIQERAGLLASLSQGLDDLKAASANIFSFSYSGSYAVAAAELLKGIPQTTAVHTAAMMFIGDSLSDLGKMLHEPDRTTRA
ncbi:hypothetical protein DC273_07555 [Salmonella enterica subsp. enterica serovar Thompson]|nr:hypothetical protein [Salmonella enterica]EBG4955659.1 hypothetical protein [Salmonella enterica subsp. enterica serovar Thompson]EAT3715293.1 hypothetical protein [Salmonella enterica]ECD7770300.1 hypothetical protein [Salmonella enterica subsp. enterica serovar Thompson]EDR6375261.1 hypothetical protein [Salmonella enterica subsp. enterica serovar Thompson]